MKLGPTFGPNDSYLLKATIRDKEWLVLTFLVLRFLLTLDKPKLAMEPRDGCKRKMSLPTHRSPSPGTAGSARSEVPALPCHRCLQGLELPLAPKIGTRATPTTSLGDMVLGLLSLCTGFGLVLSWCLGQSFRASWIQACRHGVSAAAAVASAGVSWMKRHSPGCAVPAMHA